MVEEGIPLAGGICNPATNEIFLGSLDAGVTYNGKPARASQRASLEGALVLASRSETRRGEWTQFHNTAMKIRPIGSVAYKLALVSAGLADATFTLTPKHEWDIAGGAALVMSAGGFVSTLQNSALRCNNQSPLLSGLLACGTVLRDELLALVKLAAGSGRVNAVSGSWLAAGDSRRGARFPEARGRVASRPHDILSSWRFPQTAGRSCPASTAGVADRLRL